MRSPYSSLLSLKFMSAVISVKRPLAAISKEKRLPLVGYTLPPTTRRLNNWQFDWLRAVVSQLNLIEMPTGENYKLFAGSSINK